MEGIGADCYPSKDTSPKEIGQNSGEGYDDGCNPSLLEVGGNDGDPPKDKVICASP